MRPTGRLKSSNQSEIYGEDEQVPVAKTAMNHKGLLHREEKGTS